MLQTKYITLDEFQEYFNVDLRDELGGEAQALSFLTRVENRMEAFINSNFNRNITFEYPAFTNYQKEHYKLALLEQSIYIFRNGDISVDSGFDVEKGIVANKNSLKALSIAPNCENELRLCGLWCRQIRSNRNTFGLNWWWMK